MIIEGKESVGMRETWVDYAKGIGIILVVFGHANRGLYSSGIYISPEIYHYLDNVIYSFHMPLFFFLSGLFFVSSIKNRSKKVFLWSKFKNVISICCMVFNTGWGRGLFLEIYECKDKYIRRLVVSSLSKSPVLVPVCSFYDFYYMRDHLS